jgi:hypothetical protein
MSGLKELGGQGVDSGHVCLEEEHADQAVDSLRGRPEGRDHTRVSDGRSTRGSTHDPGTSGLAYQGFLKLRRGSRQVDIGFEMDGRRQYLHPENVEVVTIAQLPDDGSKLAQADKTDLIW